METLDVKERFAIGFTSSLILPFLKLYQNGSLLNATSMDYYLGLALPFVMLGLLMGVYAWAVEKKETDSKRLFRTCFAMPGVLLSTLGTQGTPPNTANAAVMPVQIRCESRHEAVQGLIDTYDALTNNHRARYLAINDKEMPAKDFIEADGKRYWVVGGYDSKPDKAGFYYDLRDCKILKID